MSIISIALSLYTTRKVIQEISGQEKITFKLITNNLLTLLKGQYRHAQNRRSTGRGIGVL